MKFTIKEFAGIAPKIKPRNLASGYAVEAHNCSFEETALSSNKKDDLIKDHIQYAEQAKKIACFLVDGKDYFVSFNNLADTIPAFEDVKHRIFYFIDTDKRMKVLTRSQKAFLAGIPKPTNKIVVTQDKDHEKASDAELSAYRISYVDNFGNEGALSKPSNVIKVSELEFKNKKIIHLDVEIAPINTEYNLTPKKLKIRLYRSNTGTEGTYWQFVKEQVIDATTKVSLTDEIAPSKLQETAITKNWLPPEENIQHLITDGRGRAYIAYENIVSISEHNVPTAFPKEQKYYLPERTIVGLSLCSQGILVFTDLDVYLLTGENPQALTTISLFKKLPCVSKHSIVAIKDKVFYLSNNSIIMVENGKYMEVTQGLISEETWHKINSKTAIAFSYHDNYILKTDDVIIEITPQRTVNISTIDNHYKYITLSAVDKKHISLNTDNRLYLFRNSEDKKKATWRSKLFTSINKQSITCGQIEAENYPVKLSLLLDGNFTYTQDIKNSQAFRINFPRKTNQWQFQIEFHGEIFGMTLASSFARLRE